MSRPRIEFWYEFASSYSYLSVMRIGANATRRHGQDPDRPSGQTPGVDTLGLDSWFAQVVVLIGLLMAIALLLRHWRGRR